MTLDRHPLSAISDKKRGTRRRRGYGNIWSTLAEMVNTIPEDDVRQVMANHVAQFFVQQPNSAFNSESWQRSTGGRLTGPTVLRSCPDHES